MPRGSPVVRLVRSYRFAAAHFYYDPKLPQAENERLFGKCANRNGHGHNYRLDVVLEGTPDPVTGMLIDLRELDAAVGDAVLEPLDHRNLNLDVEFFARRQPTAENLAVFAWQALVPRLGAGLLERVRICESDDLSAEHRGENAS
jgi:6-pyruvoyltetrahydropterin/6-carboxytetrahydropterin synthase